MRDNSFNIRDIRKYVNNRLDNKVYVLSLVMASSLLSCSLGLIAYNNIQPYKRFIDNLTTKRTYKLTITNQGKQRIYLDEEDYPFRSLINTDKERYNVNKNTHLEGRIFFDLPEEMKGVK